jgi:hypothetical protein
MLAGLVIGCTPFHRVNGNIYEGMQMQKRHAAHPGTEDEPQSPSYDEYLRQRRELTQQPSPIDPIPPHVGNVTK